MAINKKLIHFRNYSNFISSSGINGTTKPTNGYYHNIPETSIVFIQDTKQIWTHGQLYSCPFTEEEINQLLVGSNIKLDGYSEIDSPIDILATDTVNQAIGKLEDYINSMSELNAILVDTEDVADDPAVNDYITLTQLENRLLNKQDKLVSGTNIKTINGESILGSGNIAISGSYPKESLYVSMDVELTLHPNIYYIISTIGMGGDGRDEFMVDINFDEPSNNEVVNEYIFSISVNIGFSLSLPDFISWANNDVPKWEYGYTYEISVIDNYACYAEFQTI